MRPWVSKTFLILLKNWLFASTVSIVSWLQVVQLVFALYETKDFFYIIALAKPKSWDLENGYSHYYISQIHLPSEDFW